MKRHKFITRDPVSVRDDIVHRVWLQHYESVLLQKITFHEKLNQNLQKKRNSNILGLKVSYVGLKREFYQLVDKSTSELCNLYRTKVTIIFLLEVACQKCIFFIIIFTPIRKLHCIVGFCSFLWSVEARQLSLKSQQVRLWKVMIWHGMIKWKCFHIYNNLYIRECVCVYVCSRLTL
jgi:hypothetical protein